MLRNQGRMGKSRAGIFLAMGRKSLETESGDDGERPRWRLGLWPEQKPTLGRQMRSVSVRGWLGGQG